MKSSSVLMLLIVLVAAVGCGGGGNVSSGSSKLISITLSPIDSTIPDGMWQQYTITGNYSDGNQKDLTAASTWTSSNSGVAKIGSSTGVATAVAPGTTDIIVTYGGFTESAKLTITPAILVSIAVEPAFSSMATGTTKQFTAKGLYSDNTTTILTTSVLWSSSPSGVAVVSNSTGSQGLVTTVASGTALITARPKLETISGTATLVVTGGTVTTFDNILPITVNGSLCSPETSTFYRNKACVSVTVCVHGSTTACNTISDIILDTGSFGLRIFKTALEVSDLLTQAIAANGGSLAECVHFGDGSSEWGPVKLADVIMGNEPAVYIPIQVIDSNFGTVPSACGSPDTSPSDTPGIGFNGILGIGVFKEDCGSGCKSFPDNGLYYSCNSSSCSGVSVAPANQVQNPVASLPTDNNGLIVQLPSISSSGTTSANGYLVLGIGTQSNNIPNDVTKFQTDFVGEIRTVFNGSTYNSIIDSGSNGLFFTSPSTNMLPVCPSPNSGGWFCPASTTILSAVNTDFSGYTTGNLPFQIGNYTTLTGSGNNVFSDIGASLTDMFDWGLPFFFGRSVIVGIEGQGSSLGTGPYFAY
jgi:hypothetical protein